MSTQIAVRIPTGDVQAIDSAVKQGRYGTRADAVRAAIDRLLADLREAEVAAEYARAYGEKPQEEWIGEAGLHLLGGAVGSEQAGGNPL